MTIELRTECDVADPDAPLPFMNSSPRQQRNHTTAAPRLRPTGRVHGKLQRHVLFATRVAVPVKSSRCPAKPPTVATGACANTTTSQPISAPPTPAAAVDLLNGIPQVPRRKSQGDYRRAAFGETWTDDQDAPGRHNGCDILNRDLVNKIYTSISHCPKASANGAPHDPYSGTDIAFTRGNQVGASVQIDHILSATMSRVGGISAAHSVDVMPVMIEAAL